MAVFLDTNVFLYAAGTASEMKVSCVDLLKEVAEGRLAATSSAEVLQEILHVLMRRGEQQNAIKLTRAVLGLFPNLLSIRSEEIEVCLDIIQAYPDLPTRDAVHVATLISNGISTIISADKHFDQVREIERLDPTNRRKRKRHLRS